MWNPSRRGGWRAGTSALLIGAAVAGCGSSPPERDVPTTVTIGVLADARGQAEAADLDAVRGARLAADLVNGSLPGVPSPLAEGAGPAGLAGARITIVTADTQGAAEQTTAAVDDLVVASGAAALVVSDTAAVAEAAGSQAQRLRVPVLDAWSTADYVTELGMDWYFRTVPTDRMLAEVAFALLRRQLSGQGGGQGSGQGGGTPPRLALVSDAGAQTAATAALVRDLASRAGYQVAVDGTAGAAPGSSPAEPALPESGVPGSGSPPGLADLDPAEADAWAGEIGESGCDVILALAATPAGASGAARVASRLDPPLPVLGLGPGFGALTRVPPGTPAVLRATSWSAELAQRSPVGQAVSELYQRTFGVPLTAVAANAFTATMVLAMAVGVAGSADPPAIRGALRQLTLSATEMIMPWNGVRFDADGQNQLAAGVVEGLDATGFRVVYPRELATGAMIWTVRGVAGS